MDINRKDFIKTTALLAGGTLLQSTKAESLASMLTSATKFELPPLGYAFDALEPYIDAQTMQIHYGKHHQAYVTNLNAAIEKTPSLAGKSLEDLLKKTAAAPENVRANIRNNGGGHWNHSFFWLLLKKNTTPGGKLQEAVIRDFGSIENFTQAFEKAASGQFGSGWAWLISNNGKLSITSTPNQDNPLMDVASVKGKPIIGLDVWEHAYYLKYQNKRADYIKAFWNVLNWEQAEKNYTSK